MSIDKFGRYHDFSGGSSGAVENLPVQGPRGEGFLLTTDGDYDIGGKLLRNIKMPQSNTDAVTLEYAHANYIRSTADKDKIDIGGKRLHDLGVPSHDKDAVRKSDCLFLENDSYNAKKRRLFNVKEPVADDDAVTLRYIKRKCLLLSPPNVFDVNKKRIVNMSDGKAGSTEAATVHQLETYVEGVIKNYDTQLIIRLNTFLADLKKGFDNNIKGWIQEELKKSTATQGSNKGINKGAQQPTAH